MAKRGNTLYFVYKLIGNDYQFQFRLWERSPNYVRMYLAENGFSGRWTWKSQNGKKWHYTSLA